MATLSIVPNAIVTTLIHRLSAHGDFVTPDSRTILTPDPSSATTGDRDDRGSRWSAGLEVGPPRRGLLEIRPFFFAGMLHGDEERFIVRGQADATDFAAARATEEELW